MSNGHANSEHDVHNMRSFRSTDSEEARPAMKKQQMTGVVFIVIAIGAGAINALQIGMLGNIRIDRGTFEATWISMLASLAGMALLLGLRSFAGQSTNLPSPFDSWWPYLSLTIVMTTSLLVAGRGLPFFLLATGLTSIPYLLAAAYVGPRIGLGVYFAAVVAGQLTMSVFLDHIGAFGSVTRSVDPLRIVGIGALLVGVVLIRGRS
jgi:transporter family-2 protein